VTTALTIVPVDDLVSLAEKLAPSTLLPEKLRGKVSDVLAIVMAGRELGLQPMASLRCLNVIEGKPILNADGMAAVVRGSGKCIRLDMIESTDKVATFETERAGGKLQRISYTIEQAKTAKLTSKDNWVRHPEAMLRARAKAALLRLVYEDVLVGVYSDDEAAEFARAPAVQESVIEAEVIDIDELAWQLRVSAAADLDAVTALRAEYNELPDSAAKERIAKLIAGRRSALTRQYADGLATKAEVAQ
jgi:hypothetical protein